MLPYFLKNVNTKIKYFLTASTVSSFKHYQVKAQVFVYNIANFLLSSEFEI